MEIGSVMSYRAHDKLKMRLMTALTYPAPPGYNKVGYVQVKEADAMFWELLAQRSREGIRTKMAAGFFLDGEVDHVLVDPRFTMLLTPLPKPVGAPRRERSRSRRGGGKGEKAKKDKGKGKGKQDKGKQDKGKVKGKGKEGKKRGALIVPAELLPGGVAQTADGDPICFGYNTAAGCEHADDGQRCGRGWHICAFDGCHEVHPYCEHHK